MKLPPVQACSAAKFSGNIANCEVGQSNAGVHPSIAGDRPVQITLQNGSQTGNRLPL
ncbi:MAG: hypothetical protein HC936_17730 [Leptolyngbyaceae cyanobacterium SU_3_3]|nr:hypothetical protein [Leptolyngbyaceae cyanobacterium SU_3_3]